MRSPLITGLLCVPLVSTAVAADNAVTALLGRYQQALRAHDMGTLNTLIDDAVRIEVIWTDAAPPQRFTLSKAEYLQQSRAAWRFGSRESYAFTPAVWQTDPGGGSGQAAFRMTEQRVLFGNDSGQRSDLLLRLSPQGSGWRITGIRATVSMW